MRFWDSSALVPLLIREDLTAAVLGIAREDRAVTTWWGTPLECVSAISRREREKTIAPRAVRAALERLESLRSAWHEIAPAEVVRRAAHRLLRVHPLRAADALQLAAALSAAEDYPEGLELVTLDQRIAEAARREGFSVLIPAA